MIALKILYRQPSSALSKHNYTHVRHTNEKEEKTTKKTSHIRVYEHIDDAMLPTTNTRTCAMSAAINGGNNNNNITRHTNTDVSVRRLKHKRSTKQDQVKINHDRILIKYIYSRASKVDVFRSMKTFHRTQQFHEIYIVDSKFFCFCKQYSIVV